MNFVLAMLKHPEVQRRAQQEIDSVVGNDRLPSFEDREKLPYVRALCLELLRYIIRLVLLYMLKHDCLKVAGDRPSRFVIYPKDKQLANLLKSASRFRFYTYGSEG